MIEVHSSCYDAPRLRSSMRHPKTELKKINSIPMKNSTAQVYQNAIIRNKIDVPTSLG